MFRTKVVGPPDGDFDHKVKDQSHFKINIVYKMGTHFFYPKIENYGKFYIKTSN